MQSTAGGCETLGPICLHSGYLTHFSCIFPAFFHHYLQYHSNPIATLYYSNSIILHPQSYKLSFFHVKNRFGRNNHFTNESMSWISHYMCAKSCKCLCLLFIDVGIKKRY